MADRATKDVLLRLRRVRELELRRALVVQRAERTVARRELAFAEAARRRTEHALDQARARIDRWTGPRPIGRLVHAVGFQRAIEDSVRRARGVTQKAQAHLDRVERALATAQKALGDAVHARSRSESLQRTERAAELRLRERRAEVEIEDRWRPKRRF